MARSIGLLSLTAAGLMSAAGTVGSAAASVTISPTDVITWGGLSVGRSVPGTSTWAATSSTGVATSGGSVLAWKANAPDDPAIDSTGRIYFRNQIAPTPNIGSLASPRGIFSATNNADISAFMIDGNVVPSGTSYRIGSGDLVTGGIKATNTLRVSGTAVGIGIQIGDPSNPVGGTSGTIGGGTLNLNETTSNTAAHAIDNSMWFSGTGVAGLASSLTPTMQRNTAVTVPVNEYNVVGTTGNGTARIATDMSGLGNAGMTSDMNSSGTIAFGGQMNSGSVGSTQDPIISNAANGGGAIIAAGRYVVATKTAAGDLNILQHNAIIPSQAHPFGAGSSAGEIITSGDATAVRINRNGQVAFSNAFLNGTGGVTATTNNVTWINIPGPHTSDGYATSGNNVMIYRSGELYNSSDSIGTRTSGAAAVSTRSFSNAGLLYTSSLVNPATLGTPGGVLGDGQPGNGDVSTVAGSANNSALYISSTTGTTRVLRQNDPAPGIAAPNVRIGVFTTTSLDMNNSGTITLACSLQGAGVTAPVSGSQLGNNAAIFAGTPGGALGAIARLGDAAPGFAGGKYGFASSVVPLMNNNGTVLFTSSVIGNVAADGTYSGTLASNTITSAALFGWMPGTGTVVDLLYAGQSVEVDAGVFKTISTFAVSGIGNGDGGVMGLNDNDQFTARLTFTDSTWAVVKLQVPAPGAAAMAMLGLGVMARRRRR